MGHLISPELAPRLVAMIAGGIQEWEEGRGKAVVRQRQAGRQADG